MKVLFGLLLKRSVALVMASLSLVTSFSFAQNAQVNNGQHDLFYRENKSISEQIRSNTIPAAALDAIRKQNEIIIGQGRKLSVHSSSRQSSVCGTCFNMGAENGWDVWTAEQGQNFDSLGLSLTSVIPAPVRFNITTGPGVDPLTPGVNPGDPPITLVAPPGFGTSSIQLGQPSTDGQGGGCSSPFNQFAAGCAERLTYCFTVSPTDTNFTYAYAFVMENPDDSTHTIDNMPYIEFMILDVNGDTIPCAYQRYIASESFPGQYTCNAPRFSGGGGGGGGGGGLRDTAVYKPWTIQGVNLSSYVGQTLTVVITNADCRLGGHFAHSYWDFACGNSSVVLRPNCYANSPDTLVAPASPDTVNIYSYEWYLNNDTVPLATTQTIIHYSLPGDTFLVKVILPSGCNWSARYVPLHFSVTADYIYSTHCGYVDFTAQSISPSPQDPINYWQWNFSSGTPSSSNATAIDSVFFPPGTHSVTLISGTYSPGCRDTIQYNIVVPQNPVASFNFSDICAGSQLQLSNTSSVGAGDTISSYAWNIPGGNPSSSTVINPVVTISNPGQSQITLIAVTNGGCRDTVQNTVNILDAPVANFMAQSFCIGGQLSLTNTSTVSPGGGPLAYSWSFTGGNPSTSSAVTPVVNYASTGNSTIQLIATSTGGCIDTVQRVIAIYPLPLADFSAPLNCFGTPYALTNLSSAAAGDTISGYEWTIGNAIPGTSAQQNPSVVFQTADTSLVELITTTIHGCTDTITKQVFVSANPQADFALPDICSGTEIIFTNNSTIQPAGSNINYAWNIQGGSIASSGLQNPSVLFSNAGTFQVSLIARADGGCADTLMRTINVNELPQASFSAPAVCKGSSVVMVNQSTVPNSSIKNYYWYFPSGQPDSSRLENPAVLFDSTGNFQVTLIAETQEGCVDTSTNTVTVYRPPVIDISDPDSGCVPFCHAFTDHSTSADGYITQWAWNFQGGNPGIVLSENPGEICYDTPGSYNASLTLTTNLGCTAYKNFKNIINAWSNPVADFTQSSDLTVYNPPILTFTDKSTSDVDQWRWDFGDGTGAINGGPFESHSYTTATSNDFYQFLTTLIVSTQHGCTDTIVRPNDIKPNFTFFVPNSFTPNKDKTNDYFYAKGIGIKDYDFWIFDRWGLEIWSCHQDGSNVPWDAYGNEGMPSSCRWDGTLSGDKVQQDVYVWRARVTDVFEKVHVYIGSVTVYY